MLKKCRKTQQQHVAWVHLHCGYVRLVISCMGKPTLWLCEIGHKLYGKTSTMVMLYWSQVVWENLHCGYVRLVTSCIGKPPLWLCEIGHKLYDSTVFI